MRLILLPVALLLALLAPAPAGAASHRYDVLELVDRGLKAVNRVSEIPVLLPSRLTAEFPRLYSFGRGRAGSYELEVSSRRSCHGANACFVAGFTGARGERPSATHKVRLARGRTGYYQPVRCGASCAPASVEWRQEGVLYTIQSKLGTKSTDRSLLVGLANSAIRNGAR